MRLDLDSKPSCASATDGARGKLLLRMDTVSKAYPGVVANDDVSFELRAGEIHALLGENGAGKSTLMAILFGLQQPDSGRIQIEGRDVTISTPRDAIALGIGFVQQHFSLIPTLTVLENIILSRRFGSGGKSDRGFCLRRLQEIRLEYGLGVDPDSKVEDLSVAQQQKVELLKALILDPKILILDEPGALLSIEDVQQLNRILQRLTQRGYGIILIGHKLADILSVAHRISVLRRGRMVATLDVADASPKKLSRMIVGDLKSLPERTERRQTGESIFVVQNLYVAGERAALAVADVSLSVNSGEIVGIAGIVGSGQIELLEALAGIRPTIGGVVKLTGEDVTRRPISARQARGIAFIPSDRHRDGLIGALSVAENLAVRAASRQAAISRWGILRSRVVAQRAQDLSDRFDIRGGGTSVPIATLSGGNQQKTVLARELDRDPKIVLCCYPTRGLDFAAASAVHEHLRRICDSGAGVIIASLDLDELFAVCDRIVVMQGGRIQGELPAQCLRSRHRTYVGWGDRPGMMPAAVSSRSLAIVFAFVAAGIMTLLEACALLAAAGIDPLEAFQNMYRAALGSQFALGLSLTKTVPRLLPALGIALAIRAGLWRKGSFTWSGGSNRCCHAVVWHGGRSWVCHRTDRRISYGGFVGRHTRNVTCIPGDQ